MDLVDKVAIVSGACQLYKLLTLTKKVTARFIITRASAVLFWLIFPFTEKFALQPFKIASS